MMAISSNGSLVPVLPPALRHASNVQQGTDSTAAAHAKDRAVAIKLQTQEPYHLGNAFAAYEEQAGS